MIWWLAFEKKPFQLWREIWIQVVDILLQLYIRSTYCNAKSAFWRVAPNFISLENEALKKNKKKHQFFVRNGNISSFLLGNVRFIIKGQLISEGLFGAFTFSQKTNENKSPSSKDKLFRSFFGRKWWHQKDISKLIDL